MSHFHAFRRAGRDERPRSAQTVPKRSKTERLGHGSQSVRSEAASHFPPSADNSRQPSSNVWGVGYRLVADYEEARSTA
jgi:hypothetical protein